MTARVTELRKADHLLFLVVFAVSVLVHLPGLGLWPIVNHDEVALNDAAWHLASQGTVAMPLLVEKDPSYATSYLWHPPAHMLTMALVYTVTGLSIYATRGVSLAFAALAVSLCFLVTRRLSGSLGAGLLAAFFLLSHPLWIWLARSGRMDPAAVCFGLLALLVVLPGAAEAHEARGLSDRRALLAGALLGIGSMYHLLLLAWAPALGCALLAIHRKRAWRPIVLLGLASGVPAAAWLAWVWASGQWQAWVDQFWVYQVLQRSSHTPFFLRPWKELRLFLEDFSHWPFVAAAVVTGFVAWVRSCPKLTRAPLAAGFLVSLAIVVFVMAKGTGAYPMVWFVWMAIAAGIGWQRVLMKQRWARLLLGAAVLNFAGGLAVYNVFASLQADARSQQRLATFLQAHLRPHSIVLGLEETWYGVQKAHCELHIWAKPDPLKQDYVIVPLNKHLSVAPGFHEVASLPDIMPRFFGHTGWFTDCAYNLWESNLRAQRARPARP